MKTFEATGSVHNKPYQKNKKNSRSAENIVVVHEIMANAPTTLSRIKH